MKKVARNVERAAETTTQVVATAAGTVVGAVQSVWPESQPTPANQSDDNMSGPPM
jgi:hypothetical protein